MERNSRPKQAPRGRWAVILLNLLIMALVGLALAWLALCWLDLWTGHGKEETVPDVRNQYYSDAIASLENQGFAVEISDSVYDTHARPGYVVDQNPRVNTTVKPGRVIYLTINALSPKTVILPRLVDVSSRQARAILEGLGIKNVTETQVMSEFEGLVLGATYNGKRISAGARVPVNARIVLEVGSGIDPFAEPADSLSRDSIIAPTDRYDLF